MMTRATHYSRTLAAKADRPDCQGYVCWGAILWLGALMPAAAADRIPTNAPIAYLEQQLAQARRQQAAAPDSAAAASQLARACFYRAEFPTNDNHRATLAREGIAVARVAVTNDASHAAAHYYLAMNLGQLARTKSLGALSLVKVMEQEFHQALALDEQLDYAGPDRYLGRLYFEAPAAVSVGSRTNARKHLTRAARLQPDYPENRLNLIESALRWKETKTARKEAEHYAAALAAARAKLNGEAWQAAWLDWDARWDKARTALKLAQP